MKCSISGKSSFTPCRPPQQRDWMGPQRTKLTNRRSRDLFRQREHLMAEAKLENAVNKHVKGIIATRRKRRPSVPAMDLGLVTLQVGGEEERGVPRPFPRLPLVKDERRRFGDGVGEEKISTKEDTGDLRLSPRLAADNTRNTQRWSLLETTASSFSCSIKLPDQTSLAAKPPTCWQASMGMPLPREQHTAKVLKMPEQLAAYAAAVCGGEGADAASYSPSRDYPMTLFQGDQSYLTEMKSKYTLTGKGGPLEATAEAVVGDIARGCQKMLRSDEQARKEGRTRKRLCFVDPSGDEGLPSGLSRGLHASIARPPVSRSYDSAARSGVQNRTMPLALQDGLIGFEGERDREVIARMPVLSRGERTAFVVVGLVGEVQKRVYLLPTARRRLKTLGVVHPQSVVLRWKDGQAPQRVFLTRMKRKPSIYNPLLALATILAWAQELGPDALPVENLPLLPKSLAPVPSYHPTASNINIRDDLFKNNECCRDSSIDDVKRNKGSNGKDVKQSPISPLKASNERRSNRQRGGHVLSIGAAWMFAHQVFGHDTYGKPTKKSSGGRFVTRGAVELFGGEASALSLLSCPDIGWAPEPEEVMQALSEGGGTLCGYSVSAFDVDHGEGEDGGRKTWRAASDELVNAGFCHRSQDGSRLLLHPKVERTIELCLKIFINHWSPEKRTLAGAALGMIKTGPMARGLVPPSMHTLLTGQTRGLRRAHGARCGDDEERQKVTGCRMSGRVGVLCVKLHSWCLEIRRGEESVDGQKNFLWQVLKADTAGNGTCRRLWNGPMAEALGLLGGGRSSQKAVKGVDRQSDHWMEAMSRTDKVSEPACFRLKEAVGEVVGTLSAVVAEWQKSQRYEEAVEVLRLLLRQDKGLAGRNYQAAPDLTWAADWCTCRFRGWAWIRLAINLGHLYTKHKSVEKLACLDALRSGWDDECVRGGERVDIRWRLQSSQYGSPTRSNQPIDYLHDTPPASPLLKESEEAMVVGMDIGKGDNRRGTTGRRIMFFDNAINENAERALEKIVRTNKEGLTVEEVVLRERRAHGGWAGVHCESNLIWGLMMLLLWEEIFDENARAGSSHCLTDRPFDLTDLYFGTRRKGLPRRLDGIANYTDEELWVDIDRRIERYKQVECYWRGWGLFSKMQAKEVAVAFGGRRLSKVLKALTEDLPHLSYGFPDLVLWRPKGRTCASSKGKSAGSQCGKDAGLGWEGEGQGWEVKVVEVKSAGDTLSHIQRAWLLVLRDADVLATVCRVTNK